MPAPKGNQFWLIRAKSGRGKTFKNEANLWKSACEYFEWVQDNPLKEEKLFAYQGNIESEEVSKMRAMTIDGLCLFLDIGRTTWYKYKEDEDFKYIVSKIENVIRSQKFAGAAADLLNANIIARDLGLKDHQDHSSVDRSMSPSTTELTKKELEKELAKYGIKKR